VARSNATPGAPSTISPLTLACPSGMDKEKSYGYRNEYDVAVDVAE